MPNFEQPDLYKEQELSPEQKIAKLQQQILDLKKERDEAIEAIKIEPKKKKKKQAEAEQVRLELPDNPETREVEFIKDGFCFKSKTEQGYERIATPGDLISDLNYDIYYELNHEIKSQEHRVKYNKFRREYLAAAYNKKIHKLETELLIIKRLKIDRIDLDDYYIGQIYQELYEDLQAEESPENEQAGFIFEKMISGLLTKLAVDLGKKWGFSVEQASVIDDVELKTDVIVKFLESNHGNRGVGAQENAKIKGFQLTLIDKNDRKWQRKKEQVQKVKEKIAELKRIGSNTDFDDVALLETEVDNSEVMSRYKKWKDRGQVSGGPERLFSSGQIIDQFLAKIFEDTDLDLANNKDFKAELGDYFK